MSNALLWAFEHVSVNNCDLAEAVQDSSLSECGHNASFLSLSATTTVNL